MEQLTMQIINRYWWGTEVEAPAKANKESINGEKPIGLQEV